MINISLRRSLVNTVVHKIYPRMSTSKLSYEDAVDKLNALQSNKSTIEQIRQDVKNGQKCTNLEDMEKFLARIGVSLDELDKLSVIHVAGTKGKGSTSAMCESILRRHGFRTGFYSSPHLVAVRERIRLDGRVVDKDKFAQHFHRVYDKLHGSQAFEGDMPKYFSFLTVMALSVFLAEGVDVAVVEVGIGGRDDFTNVLRKVPVVGITSLGLDHTSILGNTLAEIAASKAGIMKPGCEAYTVAQAPEAMQVLRKEADIVQCSLTVAPDYKSYNFPTKQTLPVDLEAYQTNASLAIQLSHAWMRLANQRARKISLQQVVGGKPKQLFEDIPFVDNEKCKALETRDYTSAIPVETAAGLRECRWPGRYQVIQTPYAKFCLDGAHTKESMEICAQWFKDLSRSQDKILIFSATGDRNVEVLIKPMLDIDFKELFFVIPTAYKAVTTKNDNYSAMEQKDLLDRCRKNSNIWRSLNNNYSSKVTVLECVSDALIQIKRAHITNHLVLITGSLHLVGAALSILDPNLNEM